MSPPALRALVVDDTPSMRALIESVLRRAGHEVASAEDGARALELFRSERYDIVLMDLQMPDLDGAEVARAMRRHEKDAGLPRVPLLVLTADASPDAVAACLAAGFDAHVRKPFERAELLAAVAAAARSPAASHAPDSVRADAEFADMIPGFLADRRAETPELALAARTGDFERVATAAHRLIGSGGSYGFARLSALARELEKAALERDAARVEARLEAVAAYLRDVTVVYD